MSRLAQWKAEQQAKAKTPKSQPPDKRNTASKLFDTVNMFDGGRSYGTQKPTKEGAKKSTGDQAKQLASSLFGGTEKVIDSVEALTGIAERRSEQLDKDLRDKKITREEYQKKLKEMQEDTAWAGTEDKGAGDRLKKAAGVSAQTVSEFLPVGKGVKAGQALKEGGKAVSKMARAKAAGQVGAQGAAVGAAGGAGGAAAEDDANAEDFVKQTLGGAAGGALFGAAGTAIPFRRPLDQKGFARNPFKIKANISDDLKTRIDSGDIDGNIGKADAENLRLGADTLSDDLDRTAVEQYKARIKNGEEIDPLVVKRGSDGLDYVQDGAHRLQAAKELGIRDIPTVRQKNNVVMAEKVTPPTTESLVATVKKPMTVYRAGSKFDPTKITEAGISVTPSRGIAQKKFAAGVLAKPGARTQELQIAPDTKIMPFNEIPKEMYKTKKTGEINPVGDNNANYQEIIALAKQKGYDAVDLKRFGEGEIRVWNPDKIIDSSVPPEQKLQLKVLDDLQTEARFRSPGDETVAPPQNTQTHTQQGVGAIAADIEELNQKWNLGMEDLNTQAIKAVQGTSERTRGRWGRIKDDAAEQFQDARTVAARTLGKVGDDFVYDLEAGKKYKRDAMSAVNPYVEEISKIAKKNFKTADARTIAGKRIGEAIEDSAKVADLTEPERQAYEQFKGVWDFVMKQRKSQGLPVIEDGYRPHVRMRDAASEPTYLENAVRSQNYNTKSRFSRDRVSDSIEGIDTNIFDMLPGYLNSQFNELGYDAAVKKFAANSANLPAAYRADKDLMKQGSDFLAELINREITPPRKSGAERWVDNRLNTVYSSVLRGNVRVAAMNVPQRYLANARVTKQAVKARKQLAQADADDLMKDLHYGDYSIHGQFEDVGDATLKKSKVTKALDKIDPEYKSEKGNVKHAYFNGVAQAVLESEPYKAAKKSGLKTSEAMSAALKDPEVRTAAVRKGNTVVADTQLGASSLNKPKILKQEGFIGVVPIPKKIFTMFTRFPIGMSNEVMTTLGMKDKRALEFIKYGDPRQAGIAEMRRSYGVLQDVLKDKAKAVNDGVDVGIPKEVLDEQVKVIGKNLKVIDKVIKKESTSRAGKNLKALGKLWAAAAGIQILLDTGVQSFMEDPAATTLEAAGRTNPTVSSTAFGSYSPLAGLTSASLPARRSYDGGIEPNARAIANYIPGVGVAVNRGRDIKKLANSLMGEEEE